MIKVGIVDDHQLFIDGIMSLLDIELDIEVMIHSTNGFDYLDRISKNSIDITISDIRMPEMDGLTLCRSIKKNYPDSKVLILSMYDQPSDIRDIIKARADGYLPKNVNKEELVDAIRTIISGHSVFPDSHIIFREERIRYNSPEPILTNREKEILALIAKGRSSIEIAEELQVSKFTIDTHRKNIYKKLDLDGPAALMKYAIEHYI